MVAVMVCREVRSTYLGDGVRVIIISLWISLYTRRNKFKQASHIENYIHFWQSSLNIQPQAGQYQFVLKMPFVFIVLLGIYIWQGEKNHVHHMSMFVPSFIKWGGLIIGYDFLCHTCFFMTSFLWHRMTTSTLLLYIASFSIFRKIQFLRSGFPTTCKMIISQWERRLVRPLKKQQNVPPSSPFSFDKKKQDKSKRQV